MTLGIASAASDMQDDPTACPAAQQGLDLTRQMKNPSIEAEALCMLGNIEDMRGNCELAYEYIQARTTLHRSLSMGTHVANGLLNLVPICLH